MAERYWIAAAAGVWSDSANWSATSGGAGGESVPGVADDVFFDDAALGDCALDVDVVARSIAFTSAGRGNYAGTFDAGAANVTVSGDFGSRGGGPIRMGSGQWTVGGGFTPRDHETWGETASLTMTGAGNLIWTNQYRDDGPKLMVTSEAHVTIREIVMQAASLSVSGLLTVSHGLWVHGDLTLVGKGRIDYDITFEMQIYGNISHVGSGSASRHPLENHRVLSGGWR